jgi:dTDP-L-rhamnose 4-epimerase
MTSRILISGGAGFIGTHFTKMLCDKSHSAVLLDNMDAQVHGKKVFFKVPRTVEN